MTKATEFCRDLPFTVERSEETGDGLTMIGYAAVFNQPTRINSWEGNFDEVILPGAFKDSLARQIPTLQFDHGHHPLIGSIPIGKYTDVHEDERGLHVEARLHNNWLTEPIRDAIREKSITGMSFRFISADTVDKWTRRSGDVELREIIATSVPEMGPVVFPAYLGTEVGVRGRLFRAVDPDQDPVELAEALDAVIDAATAALDDGNPEQAASLLDAAEVASDALLAVLGGTDADDPADMGMSMSGMNSKTFTATVERLAAVVETIRSTREATPGGAEGAPGSRDSDPVNFGHDNVRRLLQRTPIS